MQLHNIVYDSRTLREIYFLFFSKWEEYDRSDSFLFDHKQNQIVFSSESKGKLSLRSYSSKFERNKKYVSASVTVV